MSLLLNENPLVIMPTLAAHIGLNEAIILQQVHYWLLKSDKLEDGRKWTYNSYESWREQFPFWSVATIKRTISSLEKQELLISGNHNKAAFDKTKWYTLNYPKIQSMTNRLVQIDPTSGSNCTKDEIKLTQPIPKTTTEITTKTSLEEEKNNKKKKIQNDFTDIFSSYTANADLIEALYSFLEMRNTLKPKPTTKAIQLVLNKLDKITSDDSVKIQILENSIMHGWKGVFPLKAQQGERANESTYRIDKEGNKRDEFGCLIL